MASATTTKSSSMLSFDGLSSLKKNGLSMEGSGEGVNWVTLPHEEVPIRLSLDPNNPASLPPTTVIAKLEDRAAQFPDRVALSVKRNNRWINWTYESYLVQVRQFAKALMAINVPMFAGVSILGFNSPEWVIADVGAIFAGCLPAGIYSTNGPEACHYVAEHSKAAVIVVEDSTQLEKILAVRHELPALQAIVQWTGDVSKDISGVYSWQDFLALGDKTSDASLLLRTSKIKPGNCCALIYTSGTTGNPKAVMLSHDNITWTAERALQMLYGDAYAEAEPKRMVSYLPLSHVAAQLVDIFGPIELAATVFFAQPDALKGSLVSTLAEVRPTNFLGVPRVWEKIEEKMRATGAAGSEIKKKIGNWAKSIGLEGTKAKIGGESLPWGWNVANAVVFSNVKKALGFDECNLCFTGAAPIGLKTLEYFMSLDIPLYELYGMSESSGPHTVNVPGACKIGTVGKLMTGAEMRLDNTDSKGNGEICMRGRHVFMGYLFNKDATISTIDKDGWLHSGDIGSLDDEGFLRITGRIKELIITAGGENVPPVLIEDVIKEEIPAVSNAMVIGDKRKYLSVLLTLKSEPDAEGKPTNVLAGPTLEFLKAVNSTATSISEAIKCPAVASGITTAMEGVNNRAVSRAQHVRKWTLLPNDFTLDSGELTPTMKLKRRTVMDNYAAQVEAMYPNDDETTIIPSKL